MEEQKVHTEIPIISSADTEPSSLQMIFTLGVAGFISGLILVSAYVFTLPVIERNKEEALQEAIYRVLPGCQKYEAMILVNGSLVKQENQSDRSVPRIFLGFNEKGSVIGFAIPANEPGFADMLRILYGFDGVGKVIIGYEVLDSKETPGLGDKIFKDKHFVSNFTALAVDPKIEATKTGTKTKPNQVETITGATISSKAIIRALEGSLKLWRSAIDDYVQKNQLTYSDKP